MSTEDELKRSARLDYTAIASDSQNRHNSLFTGTIAQITNRGIGLKLPNGETVFVKWCNVREVYPTGDQR